MYKAGEARKEKGNCRQCQYSISLSKTAACLLSGKELERKNGNALKKKKKEKKT